MTARKEPHPHEHKLITLIVSSLASATSAVVVNGLWPKATLIGAAASPVLVAVFAELLRRPVRRITLYTTVRPSGRLAVDNAGRLQDIRVYRVRPDWFGAMAVALTAFVLGAGGLTVAEAMLDRSAAGRGDSTTLFGSGRSTQVAPARPQPAATVAVPAATSTTQHTPRPARDSRPTVREPDDRRRRAPLPAPFPSSSPEATPTAPPATTPEGTPSVPTATPTTTVAPDALTP